MEKSLTPVTGDERASFIGEQYVSQVRTFGALGYTPSRICDVLGLRGKEKTALTLRMSIPGDAYHDAYRNGKALGEYNVDAELAKKAEKGDVEAIETLETRKKERAVKDLRNQLFGV